MVDGGRTTGRTSTSVLGHRLVFAADEYYLLADGPFPEPTTYEGFPMHEDGVGMARTFELEFTGAVDEATGVATGFFAWVDGAPPEGYRAPRTAPRRTGRAADQAAVRGSAHRWPCDRAGGPRSPS